MECADAKNRIDVRCASACHARDCLRPRRASCLLDRGKAPRGASKDRSSGHWRWLNSFGGSLRICGASAAIAYALVLAPSEERERDVACTVGVVTVLSTAAMFAYPPLALLFGFDPATTGIFLGATIQEVPHAVAAGQAGGS